MARGGMNYGILILNKYPELANICIDSIKAHESTPDVTIVVVCDNHSGEQITHDDVHKIGVYGPFVFSHSVNIGLAFLQEKDAFLMNDDVTIVEPNSIRQCAVLACAFPNIGMLAPIVDGGVGNPYQDANMTKDLWPPDKWHLDLPGRTSASLAVCFVAVYLKRKMIEEVGLMDETFTGYGYDDNDYNIRARRKGWRTTITRLVRVKHGSGGAEFKQGENWNVTYQRENRPSNIEIFRRKYGNGKGQQVES
jgi:GT2 family glycosyltransferase